MELDSTDVEAKVFDVVRKGYDRTQVGEFLAKVSASMSRTDERRKIAEVRTEQLEREFREVKARADSTIQETVAARVRLLDAKSKDSPVTKAQPSTTAVVNQAKIEAQQILEQANVRAGALQAEAEAVIEGALATSAKISEERSDLLGSTEAERIGLIAVAIEQADEIRTEAMQTREHARADAAGTAAEVRHKAEVDADRLMAEARTKAEKITVSAEQQRDDLLASIDQSRTRLEQIDQLVESSESLEPAASLESPDTQLPDDLTADASDELEQMTVDLREEPATDEPDLDKPNWDESDWDEPIETVRSSRTSRYKSRSANLPHLGDDAASVIGSLGNLRTKD